MRKVKLLSALLAIVMVLPMVAGLGIRAAADGPLYQVLVYPKNPGELSTVQSLHMVEQTDYAQGSKLVDANKQQIKDLTDKNIEFTVVGRADTCIVGGYDLKTVGKKLQLPTFANENLKQLAEYNYPDTKDVYYVVRFVGPMKSDWIEKVKNLGGTMLDGYPLYPDTYLIRASKDKIDGIANQDFVRCWTLYTPVLKTSSWPYDTAKHSGLWQSVVVTVAGGATDQELDSTSKALMGMGAKTIRSSMIEQRLNEKQPTKMAGMDDKTYKKVLDLWQEELNSFKSYINKPVSDTDGTTIAEASKIVTFGTSGSSNEDALKGKFDLAYARVVIPVEKIADIAKFPWVVNIDLFVSPVAQNDIANYIIGSQYAWSSSELSGVVNSGAAPLPHTLLDHFGLHGESLEPTNARYGGTSYRQVVAICGTGLDTGDVANSYNTSQQYGAPVGDFAYRVMDHLGYVALLGSCGNDYYSAEWQYPPTGGNATRCPRGYWANANIAITSYTSSIIGQRGYPWMDWDGHDTHVAGSALGDGFWSRNQSHPADTVADRNPYDPTGTGILPGNAPGSAVTNPRDRLPRINLDGATYGTNAADRFDYRGVAYRAGVIVQRVTDTNFIRAYSYWWWPYPFYWVYQGRPKYIGLYDQYLPESGYIRARDAVFTILNDAYNLGAKIHIDAWVMPHRGPHGSGNGPNPAGDREITYDSSVALNSNEYNYCAEQMDRFCWEKKDFTIVQAGTTNTRLAAPFIYDFEPLDFAYFSYIPPDANYYWDGPNNGQSYMFDSPWCYTKPPMHEQASVFWPETIPQRGVYYPPIGDTSYNKEPPNNVEFNYYYQDIDQPVSVDYNNPFTQSDGKTDYATSCLSPATAKNPIVVGASESYRNIRTLPSHIIRAAGPWTYGWVYGPWFPQTAIHTHGISATSPLYGDNTANSDVPVGVQHATQGVNGLYYNELVGMAGSPSPVTLYNGYGQVAAFSGRGPTPDLDYSQSDPDPTKWQPAGRFKPDLVAPGTQIMSTASYLTLLNPGSMSAYPRYDGWGQPTGNCYDGIRQVNGTDNNTTAVGGPYLLRHPGPSTNLTEHYAIMEGTSCATGFVGGAAAIVRQYYQNRGLNMYPQPSSALIKATLIHGAANLGGQSDYGPSYSSWRWLSAKPNYDEGFGRLDLRRSLFPTAPLQASYIDQVKGITTGERHYFYYDVTDSTVPFEATMAYTDMPKLPNPQVALANDLDLIVTAPDGVEYHGNIYTSDPRIDEHTNQYRYWGRESLSNPGGTNYDRRNNVERVVIPPSQVKRGTYTVTVSGARIEQSSTNIPQTYAFRVSGGNLKTATTPAPQVPFTTPWSLLAIVAGIIIAGVFFMIFRRKTVNA